MSREGARNTNLFKNILLSGIILLLMSASNHSAYSADEARYLMRFPDVQGDLVVFVCGEDIWRVNADGGIATRLTINDGEEIFPKISPDGKLIAFTGQYDGNSDVYVMDTFGGGIKRLTYHPGTDQVVGWHPTKNKIIFASRRSGFGFSRLYLIAPDGTGLEALFLSEAAQGSFSPDGKMIAYNRLSREYRTWKRYQGGTAQDLYLFNFDTKVDRKLTDFRGTDRIPMWIGDKIYFSSDRDGKLNIYSYDPQTEKIEQITKHKNYDVRRPSMGDNKIVYEIDGGLWLLNVTTKETHPIPIEIKADAPETRPYLKDVSKNITGFNCSPKGVQAIIEARGEIFSVPLENGPTRNLTKSSGARDKDPAWSPDGKTIAFLSDKSGEYEIYLLDSQGGQSAVKLTTHKNGYRHTLRWSPDSKKIAFADQSLRCYILDVATKKITVVDKSEYEVPDVSIDLKQIYDFSWSPDSRFLAYSKMNADLVFQLYIYSLQTAKSTCVSSGLYNDFNPVFTKDGKHLLFISNRHFDPTYGDFEWEMVYKKMTGIFSLTLQKNGEALLPLKSDEVEIGEKAESGNKKVKKNKASRESKKAENLVEIDFPGIDERIEILPLPAGNYRNLAVNKEAVFYLNKDEGDFNRFEFREVGPRTLSAFSFKDREEKTVIENIDSYKLSPDGSKIIYKKGTHIGIIDAKARYSKGKNLDLSQLKMWYTPRAEWMQIFREAWRMERDFYYEPNMNGIDWPAMKEKYDQMMQAASCRQDVRYIVGELISELSTSHTYVMGGDRKRRADRVNVGMLGADFEVDKAANRYRFKKIYRVPDWIQKTIPPLTGPGKMVSEGDYLLSINGENVTANHNIYSYLQGLANQQVTLLINGKPDRQGAREVKVKTLASERTQRYPAWAELHYLDWVEHNRQVVDQASKGAIGYLHLPDTYNASASIFPKYFYSQTRKKGLIVDGRFNGGGLDPDIFLERLNRRVLGYWTRRYSHDQTTPSVVTRAHMVCLTNRYAGSGGDMLPWEFRERDMGPVIGTRSWGGLVGVSMFIPLIDGGMLTAPDYRIYNTKGEWIIENKGVQPDIEVELDPAEMARGYDAQLMKAVEILQKKITDNPRPWPKHPPFPSQK